MHFPSAFHYFSCATCRAAQAIFRGFEFREGFIRNEIIIIVVKFNFTLTKHEHFNVCGSNKYTEKTEGLNQPRLGYFSCSHKFH